MRTKHAGSSFGSSPSPISTDHVGVLRGPAALGRQPIASGYGGRRLRRSVPARSHRAVRPLGRSRTRCAAGPDHHRAGGEPVPRPAGCAGRSLAGRRRAGPPADRRRRPRSQQSTRAGRAPDRRPGAVAGATGPGPRGARHPGHGRGHRAERPRQVTDEVGAAECGHSVRPPPAGDPHRGGDQLPGRGGPADGGQAPGRRRSAGHLPTGHRSGLRLLAAGRPGRPVRGLAARGVPDRAGAHVRQRDHRRRHGVGVHLRLPAAAVGGAAYAVGAVDGRAAADDRRARVRADQADRPGRPAGPRRTDRVHPHGMVRASRRIGGGLRGGGPTARRPAGVHDRLQLRLRLLLELGRTGAARPLQPTRPRVRHRHGLPARTGPRPGPRRARCRRDATRAGSPDRRRQAPATRAAGLHLVRG